MLNTKSAILAAVLALTSSVAYAEGTHSAKSEGDAKSGITREEAIANAAERFDRADLNADGTLDRDEMKAQREAMKDHREARKDEMAGKGKDRMVAKLAHAFKKADVDKSGELSFEEFADFGKDRAGRDDAKAADRAGEAGPEKGVRPPLGDIHAGKYKPSDDDKGAREGHEGHDRAGKHHPDPEKMFERMDADGSGTVTVDEFKDALEKMRKHHGEMKRDGDHGMDRKSHDRPSE
jgi:Ca2+-binding EF-hand superfamily protein